MRSHAMGKLMSGVKKGWDVEHSLTCQRQLIKVYREATWNRREDTGNKYTQKGITCEDDAMTLYSLLKGRYFKKNHQYLYNEFFKGEVDTFEGDSVEKATKTIDIKTSWDLFSFPSIADEINDDYDYQGQCYMDLTGATEHVIAYCLINTPGFLIEKEIRTLAFTLGCTPEDETFIEQAQEVEKNSIVDYTLFKKHYPEYKFYNQAWEWDIPMEQRLFEITIVKNQEKIDAMKKRVSQCREWMNKFLFHV